MEGEPHKRQKNIKIHDSVIEEPLPFDKHAEQCQIERTTH